MENDAKKNINLIAKGVVKGIAKSLMAFIIIPAAAGGICYFVFGTDGNWKNLVAGITILVFLFSVIIGIVAD